MHARTHVLTRKPVCVRTHTQNGNAQAHPHAPIFHCARTQTYYAHEHVHMHASTRALTTLTACRIYMWWGVRFMGSTRVCCGPGMCFGK